MERKLIVASLEEIMRKGISGMVDKGTRGNWGDIKLTSEMLYALKHFGANYSLDIVRTSIEWLISEKHTTGKGFSWEDEAWTTSKVIMGIAPYGKCVAEMQSAIEYLLDMQKKDGSWNEEAWETSMSIMALSEAGNIYEKITRVQLKKGLII